ncbi:hypothetical protein AC249_AIPGENE14483, partial [Exaiptasia diaphana]
LCQQQTRGGIGRPLKFGLLQERPQGTIHRGSTDLILEVIERQTRLAVVDIGLILHPIQGHLADLFMTATLQVPVEMEFEEMSHRLGPVHLLKDHHGGILRQGFGDQRGPLHTGRHHLVVPPLVSHLVGEDAREPIQITAVEVSAVEIRGKGPGFRKRQGLGESERDLAVVRRDLDDSQRSMGIGAQARRQGRQAPLGGLQEPIDVERMIRVVIDLDLHILPTIPRHLIATGQERHEINDRRMGFVVEITPITLRPLALELAGGNGHLVCAGRHDGLEIDPIRVEVIAPGRFRVVQVGSAGGGLQASFAPFQGMVELVVGVVTEHRKEVPIAEKGAVLHHQIVVSAVDETAVVHGHRESQLHGLPHRQGAAQLGHIET